MKKMGKYENDNDKWVKKSFIFSQAKFEGFFFCSRSIQIQAK
jgi:hypothetical protein